MSISPLRRILYSKIFEFVIVLLRHILGVSALAFRRGIVIIKVTSVSCVFDLRDDGPFDLSMIQGVPVNRLEERMRLHKGGAVNTTGGNVAKPLGWIDGTEAANEVTGIG